jgi:hypothetical protein
MERLRSRVVIASDTLGLIAVESVIMERRPTPRGGHLHCTLKPVAVVVSRGTGAHAVDMDAQPVDLEELRHRCQDLDAAMVAAAVHDRRAHDRRH